MSFDEQPDGDPHGECAAEIRSLQEQLDMKDTDWHGVRGEMQAKIDALMLEYCPDEMTPEQVAEWGRHQKRVPEPTAPQLSTADVSTAPSPEGAGQGEAAEAVGLLQAVKKDLEDRAEDGVVELSSNVWQRLCDFLAKQGGK